MRHSLAQLGPLSALLLAAATAAGGCSSCDKPAGEGEAGEGEAGEGEAGEGEAGEGEAGEGEGEGDDPNAVGLDARPVNTTCVAVARPPQNSAVDVVQPWPNLDVTSPLLMLQEPGTTTMYVIERGGRIVRFDKNDAAVQTPQTFGDISDRVQTTDVGGDERGLLGMAFHPDWPQVAEIYLSYSGFDGGGGLSDNVSRFRLTTDGFLDETSEEPLISIPDFADNHNGGMIAFSPTDPCRSCLYFGDGDGGQGDDPRENGQNLQTFLAKILRIDVDRADPPKPYGIPADNPFVDNGSAFPEIYAYGVRNPWRWSFDRDNGDLWVGDVGQNTVEEIDRVEAGGNYGWDALEGFDCHDDTNGDCSAAGYTAPLMTYRHGGGRVAVMGGYVYRGTQIPELRGVYLFADFGTGEVFGLFNDGQDVQESPRVLIDLPTNVSSFSEDADGELYVLDHAAGTIKKFVSGGDPLPDTFPNKLSLTGCVDPTDATKPAAGLIPYGVNHVLWSDGALKDRFVGLPEGGKATILEDGDIDFPIGTVFMKTFRVAGQLVETRLLMKHDDGDWGGYSYEWNSAGTDADLVLPAGKSKQLATGQVWTYPSMNGCLTCHTQAAHRQLGWELAQLNGTFTYPGDRRANQLHTLDSIGIFDAPLPGDIAALPKFPAVDDAQAPVEDVARAYLHVNCSICHRPGGIGVANTDWRATTSFAQMGLCNAAPTEGDLGVTGAKRLVPGDPASSLISLRMKRLGAGRMPLLGSSVVDTVGTAAMDAWITSLTSCP